MKGFGERWRERGGRRRGGEREEREREREKGSFSLWLMVRSVLWLSIRVGMADVGRRS